MNFLDSLGPAERQAFISVAYERRFPRGARLMGQGELANYVIAIVTGWTRIIVHENGRDRVVAERGPGQLVGERGALRDNVRSASVIALGPVSALVMRSEDFASFIDAHPQVLDIVEGQIYDRLTEGQPARERHVLPGSSAPEPAERALTVEPRRLLSGENCTVLRTDVVEFGALRRDDEDRKIIRLSSHNMLRESLGDIWNESLIEDRGDGLLIVVPPHIPTVRIMASLHRGLPGELLRHNRTYGESVRFKLRVAANVGPVITDDVGMSGEAIIRTARLIDCPAIKKAMTQPDVTLGIIVSTFVYETAIRHAATRVNANGYKQVRVHVKESVIPGWLQLIDLPLPESRLGGPTGSVPGGPSRGEC